MSVEGEKAEYFLKGPTKDRRSFAIVKRLRQARTSETVITETTKVINKQFLEGNLTDDEARAAFKKVIHKLKELERKKHPVPVFSKANLRIMEDYWQKRCAHKDIRAPRSARNRLLRAVMAVGNLPLVSASATELQIQINKSATTGPKTKGSSGHNQRALVSTVNQLLKFIGRSDVQLHRFKKPPPEVRHLKLSEFRQVIPHIKGEVFKTLAWVAFATGCRTGEIFALSEDGWDENSLTVKVHNQVLIGGEIGPTKNLIRRRVRVFKEGVPYLKEWLALSESERLAIRKKPFARIIRQACVRAFPDRKLKHCVFHDLRHSYAIHLCSHNVPIDLVARSLGDSVQVCQDYYVGYVLHDENISTIGRLLDG